MKSINLQNRLFEFSISAINEVRKLPIGIEYKLIAYQLIRSATSVGANYEESQGAVSQADFTNKIGICLKEIRETNYWIRILIRIYDDNRNWKDLEQESKELMSIIGAIHSKMRKKST
ncbi:four helix bundle protein [Capnocytophaga canimorsus]|uniref:Four helix bundle protein n=1 Tax=Capnocytophaga canimorsus TaxID=28188 RepID=A0AAD0EAE6_9FLAO|nr:four helix bundle protein [Capnocytophaga canimorsus]ATA94013.1 four helix bundle protein [Capnocytophaga canimorsus]